MTTQLFEAPHDDRDRSWLFRHRWKILGASAVLGFWWNRSRQRRNRSISVPPVSEEWLAHQEFEAGKDQEPY